MKRQKLWSHLRFIEWVIRDQAQQLAEDPSHVMKETYKPYADQVPAFQEFLHDIDEYLAPDVGKISFTKALRRVGTTAFITQPGRTSPKASPGRKHKKESNP